MTTRENNKTIARADGTIAKDGNQFGITSRVVVSAVFAATLLFGVGGWAAHARLSGAVITQGQVAISQQVKLIQHRDGGIVSDIAVRNGDHVRKGTSSSASTRPRPGWNWRSCAASCSSSTPCAPG